MKPLNSKYKPLAQSVYDTMILKAIAGLSSIFCVIMLGVTTYMALSSDATVIGLMLPFYVACLFASFCYAALSISTQTAENSLIRIPIENSETRDR